MVRAECAQLTSCMTEQIRSWQFPPPVGGGTVTVAFPWLFKMKTP
jgi:hypothetical protein